MQFFEHQRHAKQATRRMLVLFGLAVLVVSTSVGIGTALFASWMSTQFPVGSSQSNDAIMTVALVAGGLALCTICTSSLIKVLSLRTGGDAVARAAGGVLVPASTSDPALRRLRNVVEEMAIASQIPVPRIYILDHEHSINAFAAGFDPQHAAIGVTRGAVQHLNRSELQAVIGHEFSHILNGDMRLNIMMLGVIHGLFVLTIVGHYIMRHSPRTRSKDSHNVVLLGMLLVAMGWLGMVCGRLIKAYVSRQREFLADASSVQFTRHPDGLSGALKKIAASPHGSEIDHVAAREEMSHMFFGMSFKQSSWWNTHPPLEERIRRIDPHFKPFHIQKIKEQWMVSPPDGLREDDFEPTQEKLL